MRKKILMYTLILFNFNFSFSQTNSSYAPKVNNIPSSPEAALLGRFGDIPVGYYTGTANVSVPLYTIKENDIEIPIMINYHGSGIKVADEATWVGLGWSLQPEGTILQEIRGKEDINDNAKNYLGGYENEFLAFKTRTNLTSGSEFFYPKIFQLGTAFWRFCGPGFTPLPGIEYDSHSIMNSLMQGNGEPDIYSYNFSGLSGKFFINPYTKKVVLIDKKEEIIFEQLAGGNGFKVTTLDGNVYIFDVVEKSYTNGSGDGEDYSGKSYKLSTIQLTNNKTINFSYIDTKIVSPFNSQPTINLNYVCNTSSAPSVTPPVTQIYKVNNIKTLQKITTDDIQIDFNLSEREDLIQMGYDAVLNPKKLQSIDIVSLKTNKKVRSFQLNYSYFLSPESSTYLGKRLKLDSVKEIGYNDNQIPDNTKPSYLFEYDTSVNLPSKNSLSIDFWGYYNGQSNTSLYPDLTYFNYYNNSTSIFRYIKSNRYADNSKGKAALLKKITYPTGGFTEFYYEPNSFSNQFIPDNSILNSSYNQLNGIHKTLTTVDRNNDLSNGETTSRLFELSKTVSIHFDNRILDGNAFSGSTAYTISELAGSYIEFRKIKNGITSLIKRWDLTSVYNVDFQKNHGQIWTEDIIVTYDQGAKYVIATYLTGNSQTKPNDLYRIAASQSIINYDDDTGVNTTVSKQCGFRISNIKNYTKDGEISSNKKIRYINEDGSSSGKLLSQFKPFQEVVSFCNYCGASNNGQPTSRSTRFTQYLLSPTDFGMSEGNTIGYSRVEEIELAKNVTDSIGKKVYTYNNTQNITKKGLPIIEYQNNGQLQSETYYDKLGNIVTQKIHTYKNLENLNTTTCSGIKIISHSIGAVDWGDPYATSDSNESYVYTYETYPINSYWYVKSGVLTTNYFNQNKLTTIENYEYNSKGKIRSIISKNSKTEILKSNSFFASDSEMAGKPYVNNLSLKNIFNIPLVTQQFNGDKKLSEQETQFGLFNGLLLPEFVYAGKESNMEKKVTYEIYDSKANIQQYTLENGVPVTILWGYSKTKPIAKIENASFSQAAAALGITTITLDAYNENQIAAINTLRANLPNAMVTTYTYIPLVGVSTITDPKGQTTTYTYDSFGRLEFVKDNKGNILSENQYNYKH
ncbi:hypothetical protein ACTJIW_23975 [Flavobacterium sp. 22659]|uniref:RHS repeat domain-containing protein n=1 Tax=Flavobacterium sp. 22659 TaxID=3453953 RepID=UPI003F84609D